MSRELPPASLPLKALSKPFKAFFNFSSTYLFMSRRLPLASP
jgi:hypothetical protein